MSAEPVPGADPGGDERVAPPGWHRLAAEDLNALAWLHHKEHASDVLLSLQANGFPATLSLVPPEHPSSRAMDAALLALAQVLIAQYRASLPEEQAALAQARAQSGQAVAWLSLHCRVEGAWP